MYKVEIRNGGPWVYTDTAEETAAFLKIWDTGNEPRRTINLEAQSVNEAERVKAFFGSTNTNGKAFLIALVAHKNGIRGDSFAEQTGFTVDKFGGIMGGMAKQAEIQGLRRESFITSELRTQGTDRFRFLSPGPFLIKYEFDLHRIIKKELQPHQISMGA